MTDKPVMEMTDSEFQAAIRGFEHRAILQRRKAETDAYMANFLTNNPDLKPKAADPTDPPPATPDPAVVDPPATPDPVIDPPPKKPVSTSSTEQPPPPGPMRASSAMTMTNDEWERALAHINSTGQLP